MSVDNASANDSAIKYLYGKLHGWGTQFLSGNYLQVRCVFHIINLVGQDGLKKIGMSVRRVREVVRWVRASPAREECFRNVVATRKMKCKKMPYWMYQPGGIPHSQCWIRLRRMRKHSKFSKTWKVTL
ncbi:Putative AC9 transposase [Linum perenne]